jgi:hypothetical protein
MKRTITSFTMFFFVFLLLTATESVIGQNSFLVGPADPNVGSNANYTTHNHYNLFDVMNPDGVILDSITIYPSTTGTPYTIVIQNASQQQIASYSGISTVGGNLPERIHADILVPAGTGYRMGLTSGSVGMLRNADGIQFPYTVPGVISLTGATFGTTYWYFFYNLRVKLPIYETDAELTSVKAPSDTTCSGLQPVTVMLKNNGPADLNFAELHWSVNNVPQPVLNWTGTIGLNDSVAVDLGHYNFQTGTTFTIVANVFEPNGFHDSITHNDTVQGIVEFVTPSPEADLTIPGTITICQGDSVTLTGTLTGTGPWHLTLMEGQTTHQYPGIQTSPFSLTFHPNSSTDYILTMVSDATGCSSEVNDTVQVLVTPQPPAAITPVSPSAICAGDSIVLMGSVGSGFTYEWYKDGVLIPGTTGFTLVAKDAGDYTVKVTSPVGCSNLSQPHQLIVNPLPVVSLGGDTAVLPGTTLTLDAGSGFNSYFWNTGETTQTIDVDSSGIGIGVKTIWVMVTDNFSCEGRDEININFTPHPAVEGALLKAEIKLFPNPSSGLVNMELNGMPFGNHNLSVMDARGQTVHQAVLSTGNQWEQHQIDLSHLAGGIYFLHIKTPHGVIVEKIVFN